MTKFTVYLRIKTEDKGIKSQKLKWECSSIKDAYHLAVKVFESESREVVGMTICKGSKTIMTIENGGHNSCKKRSHQILQEVSE